MRKVEQEVGGQPQSLDHQGAVVVRGQSGQFDFLDQQGLEARWNGQFEWRFFSRAFFAVVMRGNGQ